MSECKFVCNHQFSLARGFEIKRKYGLIFLILAVLFAHVFLAEAGSTGDNVQKFHQSIDQILADPCLKSKSYGVEIYSLDKREILYQTRKDHLFVPASNQKLVTTAAALKYLGPDYRYSTRLFTTGEVKGDTLYGDLYIKGYGDPKLVSEQMWLLVNELRDIPIHKVVGSIIADSSFFDSLLRVKTWGRASGAQAYNAPLGALSFNFNTVTVYVTPGSRAGDKPLVVVEPDTKYIKVKNKGKTLPSKKRGRLILNRLDRGDYDEVSITGGISKDSRRARYYVNITDPTRYTLSVFKDYLSRAGIEVVSDTLEQGVVPEGAKLLINHESEPLSLALRGLNKFSNNLVAEQIIKTLGAEKFGSPGTTENGLRMISKYMRSLGFSQDQYRIVDGSGLSRQNRLTANQIVSVLEHVHDDLSIYPEFISALGVMGLDGNVRKRMNAVADSQKARVKTGTLKSVSTLSGYFQSRDGELFAFSILMNDLKCRNGKALDIQDKIVREGLTFVRGRLE